MNDINEIINSLHRIENIVSNNDALITNSIVTIVGVVIGYFLNAIQHIFGKFHIYCNQSEIKIIKQEAGFADDKQVLISDDKDYIKIRANLDFVNTKNNQLFIRDIKLCIKNAAINEIQELKDVSTWRNTTGRVVMSSLNILNLNPRSTYNYEIESIFNSEKTCKNKEKFDVLVVYKTKNNRKRYIKLFQS